MAKKVRSDYINIYSEDGLDQIQKKMRKESSTRKIDGYDPDHKRCSRQMFLENRNLQRGGQDPTDEQYEQAQDKSDKGAHKWTERAAARKAGATSVGNNNSFIDSSTNVCVSW